jgi:3-keto-5-aminohexanoate cleavage enzyme
MTPPSTNAAAGSFANAQDFMERVRLGMSPLMICVACNGGVQGRETNDNIPETADEIADSVHAAYQAGASIVHVHARNPNQLYSGARTAEDWVEVNSKIRERCPDIIINNTTGGDLDMSMDDRLCCLEAAPDIASLNLTPDMSRVHFRERLAPLPHPRAAEDFDGCIPFTYATIRAFAQRMQEKGIAPEMEVYHPGAHWVIRDLIDAGLIKPPYLIQTVMGYQTSSWPTPQAILDLLRDMPAETVWLCSGIGPYQLPLTTFATLMGGHVRVGLEDNIYYSRGRKLTSNAEAVSRAVRIAHELNREIATPAQARVMLGLRPFAGTAHS